MQSLLMFLAAVAASTGEDCTEDIRPYIQERIIGGIPAKVGEFPYIVFIRTVFGEGAYEFYRHCGGSIIAKDWVLTAAHCLEVNDCPRCSYQRSVLRAGSSYQEEGGIVRSSSTAITQTSSIGLLKVEEEWPLQGPCISPARLPREASLVPGGSPATIVGWGGIPVELVGRADLLKQQVEVISYKQCVSKYKEIGLLLHNTEMCTIFREGQNVQLTWEKDVGCPVIVNDTVVGIVQGGNVGGSEVLPDVHVRVSAFIEWITTVTGGHLPFLSPDIH